MQLLEFLNGGLLRLNWYELILATLAMTHVTIAAVTIFLDVEDTGFHFLDGHQIVEFDSFGAHGQTEFV